MRLVERLRDDDRARRAAIAVVGVSVLLPYVLLGPGLFVDDWFTLRNARLDGWWTAAGQEQWRARPGAGVVYALTFGLFGARPLIFATLAAVVLVATALVLETILRRVLSRELALAVPVLWLLVPNHTSLEAWPSALNIAVALLLAVLAAERLSLQDPTNASDALGVFLLGASVLCYEATGPIAVAVVVAAAFRSRRHRKRAVRVAVLGAVVLAGTAAWMLLNWHPSKAGIDARIDLVQLLEGHVGSGVVGANLVGALVAAVVLIVTVLTIRARVAETESRDPESQLIGWGWAVIALGAVPFVRYFYSPVGLGDRVTVVSGLGGAAVLGGTILWLGRRRTALGVGLALVLLIGAVGHRASLTLDYVTTADDSRRIVDEMNRRWPEPPDHRIVFGPYPVMKRNIVAFIDADWVVQWNYGTRDVVAGFTLDEETFASFPEEERLDVAELSDLPAVDRLEPPGS